MGGPNACTVKRLVGLNDYGHGLSPIRLQTTADPKAGSALPRSMSLNHNVIGGGFHDGWMGGPNACTVKRLVGLNDYGHGLSPIRLQTTADPKAGSALPRSMPLYHNVIGGGFHA